MELLTTVYIKSKIIQNKAFKKISIVKNLLTNCKFKAIKIKLKKVIPLINTL